MSQINQDEKQNHIKVQRAWVVFSGETDLVWLRFILRAGFRHCFVLLHDGRYWISVDPLAAYTDIQIHDGLEQGFCLSAWLAQNGYQVVKADLDRGQKTQAPLSFVSCVEVVKRVLGLRHRFIVTPYQLYKFLKKQGKGIENDIYQKGEKSWVV